MAIRIRENEVTVKYAENIGKGQLAAECVIDNALAAGGSVRGINAKGLCKSMTRKDVDACADYAKSCGAKGLAYAMLKEDGSVTSSFFKFLPEEKVKAVCDALDAKAGDVIFVVADASYMTTVTTLGSLRCYLAEKYSLYDKSVFDFLWVVDFPLLEYSEEEQRYVAVHHPFTAAKPEDVPLLDTDPLKVRSNAYDIVINGQEAGGGSIRIHDPRMQEKIFSLLGLTEEEIEAKFGFFVEAFRYGAPPHGGLAFGLDRLVMIVTGTDNIKDVIAFPKVQNASCLMTGAPSTVENKQLEELALVCKQEKE